MYQINNKNKLCKRDYFITKSLRLCYYVPKMHEPKPSLAKAHAFRERFDKDVERFSSLETGQVSTIDSALVLNMISQNIALHHQDAVEMCDIGCGAGNFTLKVLQLLPHINSTLIDLSKQMLKKAKARIEKYNGTNPKVIQDDIRNVELTEMHYDFRRYS